MIHRAKFQNFKALRDVEVTFDSRLTVLVGPNGSGKTSVLQGIQVLCQLVDGRLPEQIFAGRFGLDRVASCGIPKEMILELSAGIASEWVQFRAVPQPIVWGENRSMTWNDSIRFSGVDDFDGESERGSPSRELLPYRSAISLRLDAQRLAAASYTDESPPKLQSTGAKLASCLAYLALNRPQDFQFVVEELRAIVPSIEAIRFDREPVLHVFPAAEGSADPRRTRTRSERILGDSILFDFRGATGVHASLVSEGTLHTLGLLTAICSPTRVRTILLDDLGHALHPKAQIQLIDLLRKLLAQFPDLQIIATSHSPFILNQLGWNEVRVTALNDNGAAICKPLTDHPDFERWKESMSPGEFWSTFYEDWLTKPREPQPVS